MMAGSLERGSVLVLDKKKVVKKKPPKRQLYILHPGVYDVIIRISDGVSEESLFIREGEYKNARKEVFTEYALFAAYMDDAGNG